MLASLFSNPRLRLLALAAVLGATGCTEPEIDRPGTWKAVGINDQNLRAMLVNPQDIYVGTAATTSRGDAGSRAVTRLLADRRRTLLDASASKVAPASSGSGDSGPAPVAGGTTGGSP